MHTNVFSRSKIDVERGAEKRKIVCSQSRKNVQGFGLKNKISPNTLESSPNNEKPCGKGIGGTENEGVLVAGADYDVNRCSQGVLIKSSHETRFHSLTHSPLHTDPVFF